MSRSPPTPLQLPSGNVTLDQVAEELLHASTAARRRAFLASRARRSAWQHALSTVLPARLARMHTAKRGGEGGASLGGSMARSRSVGSLRVALAALAGEQEGEDARGKKELDVTELVWVMSAILFKVG